MFNGAISSFVQLAVAINLIGTTTFATSMTRLVQECPGYQLGSREESFSSLPKQEHAWETDGIKTEAERPYRGSLRDRKQKQELKNKKKKDKKARNKQREETAVEIISTDGDVESHELVCLHGTDDPERKSSLTSHLSVKSPIPSKHDEKPLASSRTRLTDRDPDNDGQRDLERDNEIDTMHPAAKEISEGRRLKGTAEASEIFDSVEKDLEKRLKGFYTARIKFAFQPRETNQDGEIFPRVIKPLWAHAIHTEECARLLKACHEDIQRVPKTKNMDYVSLQYHQILGRALEILEPHLQTTNHQDHLPLPEMDGKILSKYELHRRLIILTNQIIQKTAVENWKLISTSLATGGNKRRVIKFLSALKQNLQLDREFPETVTCFQSWLENPGILLDGLGRTKVDAGSLIMSVMGPFEYRRRFNFEILHRKSLNINLTFKPQTLPLAALEDLRIAERTNGVDVWNVSCFIQYLGLGGSKNFKDSTDNEIRFNFERILVLINCETYWYVPWSESADRAWLTKTYKEYYEQLKTLCDEHKRRFSSHTIKGQDENVEAESDQRDQVIHFLREDSVIFYDQGIPLHVFTALNKLRLVNTKASVNFKTSISTERGATLTDWDTVFNSCPWKFNTFQKEFIHAWFDAN
ncbi:hypothetical protein MJO28_007941 [Puccinia striiformis f. sp. tritici]|uniref:Uncharacterized protein n=2 Tax=Puccinia striiformis TaxID=27350 RepID=A0A2S4UJY6_9BASI|nr:hypothetical protein MJO28_007941 [Puccinia striiformis f. sp. tritici]POV97628.1 hypothetical protein PSHT_14419 [Puccinia striiformis]